MGRVSEQLRFRQTNDRVAGGREALDRVQEMASSGQKLRRISDDPAGTVRVLQGRERILNIVQFRKSLDFARGFLSRTEDALKGLSESLNRARELAVQQANSTWGPTERSTVSKEVRQIIDHCISLGNSSFGERFVFGGFRTQHPPITQEGRFVGDDGMIYAQMDEDIFYPVNIPGREIFDIEPDEEGRAVNLVDSLRLLYDALSTNDQDGIQSSISALDASSKRVLDALATVGARSSMVENVESRLNSADEHYNRQVSNLSSTDLVQTALELKRAQTSMEYTLQASGQVLTPSLLQFLK